MANTGDTTRLVIELEVLLRNLNKTLQGLDQVKKKLQSVASVKPTAQFSDRATIAAQRLSQQQQKLVIQSQELVNRQERARQSTDRLALSQQRLSQAQTKSARTTGVQADAHVRAFRAIQKGIDSADAHVQFFKANERALARAPQLDNHVQAFRAIERQVKQTRAEQEKFQRSVITLDQTLGRIGGSLRNLGLGLTSLGSSLSIALTAPLTAIGVLATQNAVTLDSLKRGLVAITGSASEAGRQLERLTQIAKLPGIGFQEAIQGSIRLQAVGFSAEKAEKALVQFSNAVALTGGGRAELDRITVQLGQLSAKGKVLSQDLKPIIEAGPAVGRALKEAFGTVNAQDIEALGISSEEFLDQLVKQLSKLPRAAAGLRNTFDNFTDAVFRASAAIGEGIVPVLTRLVEVAEPVITRLSEGFKNLSPVLQTIIVSFGGLTAAIGPTLFIAGQLATGIGGLVSAFGRLHALGLIPTIKGFQLLTQVMRGSASLAAGQAATTAAAAAGWGALGVAILAVVGLAVGIGLLLNQQKDAIKISKEQIAETDRQIESLKDQIDFLDNLKDGVERTADEQERLSQIYADLNTQAKVRLTAISDEEQRLKGLREELERLLRLRNEERVQQAANLAASLADTAQQLQLSKDERASIADRVKANAELADAIQRSGKITSEQSRQLALQGINAATAQDAIGALSAENENLIASQGDLIKSSKELNGTAEEQGAALKTLQQQTGLSTRELLNAAKAMGVFKGDVESVLPTLERFINTQDRATESTDAFTRALAAQSKELLKAGEDADNAEKRRKALIDAAVSLSREASTSFAGALKFMRAFIAAQPELAAAIQKELQLQQKSMDEFLADLLRKGTDKGGQQLRSAREQLANSILEVASAQVEKEQAIQKAANDRLLEANEISYASQLRAYREYLETRALFTQDNLDTEIRATLAVAKNARLAQARLLASAQKQGISEAEKVKRRAQAAEQEEKAIKAETKLVELDSERAKIANDLKRALAEANVQQIKDIQQLSIEFGELEGRIQEALDARTVEKFREQLQQLTLTQTALTKQLEKAKQANDGDKRAELERAIRQNQSQIDLIQLIAQQEFATNKLAAAQEFVRRAKERQAQLESDLAFQVEFRGLKEEEAIQKRLEGERKLADSLRIVRDLVAEEIQQLNARGIKPPQALLDFVREVNNEVRQLGQLSFGEQFRLVEKEFNRLNDERLNKIADIERAVRERDIAEAEGLLIIRRINEQYSADLEEQVRLLKEIAATSQDANLARQAQAAEQTAKDANSQLASFNRQLRSAEIDALQDGFTEFFKSLNDQTLTAKEKLLNLVNSVAERIEQVIAENLSKKLIESLFGDGTEGEGILAKIRGIFGSGGKGATGGAGAAVASGVQTADATTASVTLQTGATTAAATLTTGAATASASLVASLATAAASFAALVTAAGAAFAATVAASSAVQGLGGLGSSIGAAATGIFPAVPGGVVRVVEGGFPEAVLTTDPKHAQRQVAILRAFLRETRGLGGRIRGLAMGGFVLPDLTPSVSSAGVGAMNLSGLDIGGDQRATNLRILNLLDKRQLVGGHLRSAEGAQDILNVISENSDEIGRRLRIR